MEFQRQSVHSPLDHSGISGIRTSSGGGLPSGSCHMNSRPPRTSVGKDWVRATRGVRLE